MDIRPSTTDYVLRYARPFSQAVAGSSACKGILCAKLRRSGWEQGRICRAYLILSGDSMAHVVRRFVLILQVAANTSSSRPNPILQCGPWLMSRVDLEISWWCDYLQIYTSVCTIPHLDSSNMRPCESHSDAPFVLAIFYSLTNLVDKQFPYHGQGKIETSSVLWWWRRLFLPSAMDRVHSFSIHTHALFLVQIAKARRWGQIITICLRNYTKIT